MAAIGMSVPGATDLLGSALGNQVAGESEDERRRRLLAMQQNKLLPTSTPGASALGLSSTGYSVAGGLGR
jgi:hypothetical protein